MKKELRQRLRKLLAEIPPEVLHERSRAACQLFCQQREYRAADVIMIYLATPSELDTSPIALQAWEDRKRVLAPMVSWEQRRMLPVEIHSLISDVRPGVMGIREPLDGMPIPVADIDVVIVPGLGFDEWGNRLGRGRGFYDRFLSHRDFRGLAVGLALEEQVLPNIPTDQRDMKIDMLVTDQRVRRFLHATARGRDTAGG